MTTPILTTIPEVGDTLDPFALFSPSQLKWWPKTARVYCSEFLVETLTLADIALEARMIIGLSGPSGAGKSVAYELIMALAAAAACSPCR